MDEQEARRLLGLEDGPISLADLRKARNNALKAHHPDKVGTDPADVRRATYWTTRINAAYDLLEQRLAAPSWQASRYERDDAAPSSSDRAGQARQRARQDRASEAERVAAQERAAAARAEELERVAAHERADEAAARRRAATSAWRRAAPIGGVILAVVAILAVLVSTAGGFTDVSGSPGASPASGVRQAQTFYQSWASWFATNLSPCHASPDCPADFAQTYQDGRSFIPEIEIPRVARQLRDEPTLTLQDQVACPEERGSVYALLVAMSVDIELVKATKPGEIPPDWSPLRGASWAGCSEIQPDGYRTQAEDLRTAVLPKLRGTLADVATRLEQRDWDGARALSTDLLLAASDAARQATRDSPPGGGTVWRDLGQIAWDSARVSAFITVPRLAAADSTAELVKRVLTDIDAIDVSQPFWP